MKVASPDALPDSTAVKGSQPNANFDLTWDSPCEKIFSTVTSEQPPTGPAEELSGSTSFRQSIDMPKERGFLLDPPPRPVDKEQIRALHEGRLPRDLELEIRDLTLAYREWADASHKILLELVKKEGA
jgi:hypothetical protein